MLKIIHQGRVPIKMWCDEVEEGAMRQAVNLSNLPWAFKHIALMPDVHEGYGMPIGGVLASDGMIIPNAVGVDIGCGVMAIKTDVQEISWQQIKKVIKKAEKEIPVGFKHNKQPQAWEGFHRVPEIKVIRQELQSARHQLGSLGGGNHFCSIEQGSDRHIWLLIHSGSRNIGLKVANHFNKIAKGLNKTVPRAYDLASLPLVSPQGQDYLTAMSYCISFAEANRELIAARFHHIFADVTGCGEPVQTVRIHHNYAAVETHFGKEVVVHRKGANAAREGQPGIIPGSMGTASYLVKGLGNPESFMSCSHGCGRVMSRKRANQTLSEAAVNEAMRDIYFTGWKGDYSEAPLAYKDIEVVMEQQKDLVKPSVRLNPLGVMKG